MTKESLQLVGYDGAPSLTVKYHSRNRLPMATLVTRGSRSMEQPVVMSASRPRARASGPQLPTRPQHCVTSPTNVNLSEPEKELLRWHQRLGHISFRRVQWLMRQGLLSSSTRTRSLHSTACKLSSGPLCTACQYAKQRRNPVYGRENDVTRVD